MSGKMTNDNKIYSPQGATPKCYVTVAPIQFQVTRFVIHMLLKVFKTDEKLSTQRRAYLLIWVRDINRAKGEVAPLSLTFVMLSSAVNTFSNFYHENFQSVLLYLIKSTCLPDHKKILDWSDYRTKLKTCYFLALN